MAINSKILDALLGTMVNMEEVKPYVRILIYGESGAGKTVLGSQVGHKVLYVEADPEGWVSLLNHPNLTARNRMSRMDYQGLSQLDAICQAIEEEHPQFKEYDTIFIDTLNHVAILDLDGVVRKRAAGDPSKSEDVAMLPDYNFMTERMRKVITRLCNLPVHIIFAAHAREDKDEQTGMILTRPDFTPKLRKHIERIVHITGYLTAIQGGVDSIGQVEYSRKLQVHPTRKISAKSRIGGLPAVIDNPNLGDIVSNWVKSGAPKVTETPVVAREFVDSPASSSQETTIEGIEI